MKELEKEKAYKDAYRDMANTLMKSNWWQGHSVGFVWGFFITLLILNLV